MPESRKQPCVSIIIDFYPASQIIRAARFRLSHSQQRARRGCGNRRTKSPRETFRSAPRSPRIRRGFNLRPQIGMTRTIGCFTRAVERTVHAKRDKLNRKLFTHGRKKLFMPTEEAYGCAGAGRSAK